MRFIAAIVVFGAALLAYRAAAQAYLQWAVGEIEESQYDSEYEFDSETSFDGGQFEAGDLRGTSFDP